MLVAMAQPTRVVDFQTNWVKCPIAPKLPWLLDQGVDVNLQHKEKHNNIQRRSQPTSVDRSHQCP